MFFLYKLAVSILRKINVYEKRVMAYSSLISSVFTLSEGETILDIGTGTGEVVNKLSRQKRASIIGLDIDKHVFINKDQRLFYPIVADAHYMPFKNEVFDITLSISCLEHLENPSKAIAEISRITKKNGICITQIPNLQWLLEPHTKFPLLYFLPSQISSIILRSTKYTSVNFKATLKNVISWFNQEGFTNTLRKPIRHGLKIFEIVPWPLGWFLVFQKIKAN